jgi:hypothetical protein
MPRYARFASHHRKARDTFAPTHRLSARHDKSRDQTDDKTENDQPNDVHDDYESPSDSDWGHDRRTSGPRQPRYTAPA